jgi:hypothetical protein
MNSEAIRDSNGNLLFWVETGSGMRMVRDFNGNLLGRVGEGETRDPLGNLILNAEQAAVLYKGPLKIT